MMGKRTVMQEALFYSFRIEDHVPADHLLRSIDRLVDLSGIREHLKPFYSATGRPSIDPELMIRMLIVGYCMGIHSERRLCEEVHLNLAYRWFCQLDLDGAVPDHSTFSKNRHGRFRDSDLLRKLFEMTVQRCMAEGLAGADGFAVDVSLIRADVHRQRSVPGEEGLPSEAAGRAVAEYLDVLDDAAFGGSTPVTPKRINLIDLDHAVIVDVEATTAFRQAEVTAQRRMIERTQERFGLLLERLVADTAYGSAPNLAWLVEDRGIEPHIPVFDKSARSDEIFERSAFTFDHEDDSYICPAGNRLRPSNRNFSTPRPLANADGFIRYRAREKDCAACGLKKQCTPTMAERKIMRSVHEGARDVARHIATSDAYLVSRRQRKKIEMLFAHLNRILKLDPLRLRGPNGAKDEIHLAAAAKNLRKLAKIRPMPGLATA